jgi:hypothetical protein
MIRGSLPWTDILRETILFPPVSMLFQISRVFSQKVILNIRLFTSLVVGENHSLVGDLHRFCCQKEILRIEWSFLLFHVEEAARDSHGCCFMSFWWSLGSTICQESSCWRKKKFQSRFLGERIAVLWPDLIRIKFSFEKRHSRESCLSWDGCSTNNWHERGSEHEITELVH